MAKKWNNIGEFLIILKQELKSKGCFYFRVKIISKTDKTEFIDVLDDEEKTIKLKVSAVPEKEKANKAIIRFFKKEYRLKAQIISGSHHNFKLIKLENL